MRKLFILMGLWLLCNGALSQTPDALHQSVSRFFDDFQYSNAQLSPDGQSVAVYYSDHPGVTNLVVIDLATMQQKQITDLYHSRIGWSRWIDNKTLAFSVESENGWVREDMVYNTINKDGGDLIEAAIAYGGWSFANAHAHVILDMDPIGPVPGHPDQEYVSSLSQDNKSYYPGLYTFNWRTGQFSPTATKIICKDSKKGQDCEPSEDNQDNIVAWFMDPAGQLRAAMAVDNKLRFSLLYRDSDTQPWRTLAGFTFGQPGLWPVGFDASGKKLYVLSDIGTPTKVLRIYDLASQQLGPILFQDPKSDIEDVDYSVREHRPLSVSYGYGSVNIVYLDPIRAAIAAQIGRRSGHRYVVLQVSDDGDTYLAYAYTDPYPGTYYLYKKKSGSLIKLFDLTQRFAPGSLAQQHAMVIKARDGVQLPSYLTNPTTGSAPWPMVVLVHGGPFGMRDYPGYDPEVQLLASQGFAVLQVNFRGSGGFGRVFEQLGWKQWGGGIQNDIADATRWVIAHNLTRPGSVCIYGGSFGGYSALMSLVRYPKLFQCGVSFAGVTDLEALLDHEKKDDNPLTNAWLSYVLGDVKLDKQSLEAESPYYNIQNIHSPIFIAHGSDDETVPLDQTTKFADKFKKEGVTSGEMLILPGEGHGIAQPETQMQFYSELIRFLHTHIGAGAPAIQGVQP
ncbi:MAG TPA: alpha/beta fold hydrolase [Gammaproteobacteria bacterium]|nr:alpha/beta fold hydrolase [Gammaproteobacteria bacterium]